MVHGLSTENKNKIQGDDLKRRLIECIKSEKIKFLTFADLFYKNDHREEEDYIKLCKEIIVTVDRILNEDKWDDSLFLRNAIKPLREIKQQAEDILAQVNPTQDNELLAMPTLDDDMTLVYISIFQSDGHNLKRWELQLRSILRYLVGRPVYEKENEVQRAIRLRLVQTSEAYIVVAVKKTAIINDPYQPKRVDRNESTLLTLAPNAVKEENILKFVHQNKSYRVINGRLVEVIH